MFCVKNPPRITFYTCNILKKQVAFSTKATNIPRNAIEHLVSAQNQPENGFVYDKKPIKLPLQAGKRYLWCLCGQSHTQPFCDGTHKNLQLKIKHKPLLFAVEETKDYWLCNCKHTTNRPFCDGTHRAQIVQDANSVIKQ